MKKLLQKKSNLDLKPAAWFLAIFYGWASVSIDAAESSVKMQQEFTAIGNAIGKFNPDSVKLS